MAFQPRQSRFDRCRHTSERDGLTLIELLLVLVIFAITAALVFPRLFDAESRQSLRGAADQLNGSLVSTRHQSMAEGQSLFLLYQVGTPLYAVVAEPLDDETRGQFDQVTTTLSQIADSYEQDNDFVFTLDGTTGIRTLPTGIRFFGGESGVGQANDTSAIQAEIAGLPFIAFAPDGTTDDAVIELVNDDLDVIAIQLRGLTGTPRIGEMTSGIPIGGPVQP